MEWLKNKAVLLDTNILILISRKREPWRFLFEEFEDQGCVLLTSDAVRYEFIKFASNWEEREELEALLETIDCIQTRGEDVESALEIATTCSAVYPDAGRRMSLPDGLLAAALRRFGSGKIMLVTTDLQDFSAACFDLVKTISVEQGLDQQWIVVGFFVFNEEKFSAARKVHERKTKKT